jgi:hypothetical protein
MAKLWTVWNALVLVQASPIVQQRICTDAELALLSLQQSIQGGDLNNCIQTDPQTHLATSISLKACLMTAGATELCASCYASINDAYSQCVTLCNTGSETPSNECTQCVKAIQSAYELSDDQMLRWQLYDICRTAFADDRGLLQTTGIPPTTSVPILTNPPSVESFTVVNRNACSNKSFQIPVLVAIILIMIIN